MRTPGLLFLLSTTACVPLISEDTDTKDDGAAAPEASEVEVSEAPTSTDSGTPAESDTDSESGPDTEPDPDVEPEPDPEPDPEPEPEPTPEILSGEYWFQTYALVEDPCGWGALSEDIPFEYLPTSFMVESEVGYFDIEARRFDGDFGTTGPVRCTFEGDEFTCEPQDVIPRDGLLGSYGWRYVVTFSGMRDLEAARGPERVIIGRSTIEFSVDPELAPLTLPEGYDVTLCTQVLEMKLYTARYERH